MSDTQASDHAMAYVEKTIGGEAVRFGKLSVRDRAEILARIKKTARDEKAKALADGNIEPEQAYIDLRAHDAERWGPSRWAELANSYDGQVAILTAALKKQNYTDAQADQILASMILPPQDELELVCEVANLPLTVRAPLGTRQIGTLMLNGEPTPIFIGVPETEGGDEAHPTAAAEKEPQTKNPKSYGK